MKISDRWLVVILIGLITYSFARLGGYTEQISEKIAGVWAVAFHSENEPKLNSAPVQSNSPTTLPRVDAPEPPAMSMPPMDNAPAPLPTPIPQYEPRMAPRKPRMSPPPADSAPGPGDVPPNHERPPHDLEAVERLRHEARAFSYSRQWPEAINAWWRLTHVFSGANADADREAYFNLGVAYEEMSDWAAATDALEQAVSLDSTDISAPLHLAHCYTRTKHWSDAVATYQHVLHLDPYNENAKKGLKLASRRARKIEK